MRILMMILMVCMTQGAVAAKQPWNSWVHDLKYEAMDQGISGQFFDYVFSDIRPNRRVISFDRSQPERRLDFKKYRRTRASKNRIAIGRKEYKRHQTLLTEVSNAYGVDPCFIVSLWGMESSYGRFMGSFPVLRSLATLAYDNRRADFFRKELLLALHIVQDGHVKLDRFKGEWAGASGQPQFLPSSWHKFAVDYNGDGRKDIWDSHGDIFASIANYLKGNGWQTGQPWAVEIKVPSNFDRSLKGKKIVKPVTEWQAMGIRTADGGPLPHQELEASVIMPEGGPYLLGYNNFRVIMRYNNSTYYAGSIGYMADKICGRRK